MNNSQHGLGPFNFEDLYCKERGINPDSFERSLLIDGVPFAFRPLIQLSLVFLPRLFQSEIEYLNSFRGVQDRRQFLAETAAITDFNLYQLPRWRAILRLRVSTRRLSRLRKLLPKPADENLAPEEFDGARRG